ncbi:MAG: site-specific integrase [Acidimicrobiales bacterium]
MPEPSCHVAEPSAPSRRPTRTRCLQAPCDNCAASTVRAYGTVAGEFLAFTAKRGTLAVLHARTIDAFVATLAGYQAKTVEHKLCAVRSFVRFAGSNGLVDGAVLGLVPAAKSTRQTRIPSVWGPAEVKKILEAVA